MSNDFDNNFDDDFNNDDFDDFKSGGTFKEVWDQNPLVKIVAVILGVVAVVALIVYLLSGTDDPRSRVSNTPDQSEAPGGEVSQTYADAIIAVNEDRTEAALSDPNKSAVPIPFNLQEQDLLTDPNDAPNFDDFDPLAAWRQQAIPEEEPALEEPVEPVLVPFEGPIEPQPVPGPSPDVVNSLAQAMSQQMGDLKGLHNIDTATLIQVTPEDYLSIGTDTNIGSDQIMVDTDGDGVPDTLVGGELDNGVDEEIIETVIIPAGTINYGQMLLEANSDVPGPVLVQLVSGPLAGARMIGRFTVESDVLVIEFNSIVVDGLNSPISAIAIDPGTTLPGVATEVDKRYFARVLLPAAGEFIEGLGRGFAQTTETTIVSGDVVTTSTTDLDVEQEFGVAVEEAAQEINQFVEREANAINPLVRVERGTPVGVFFLDPVTE
jgi:intracellular multiplication protein IcmE